MRVSPSQSFSRPPSGAPPAFLSQHSAGFSPSYRINKQILIISNKNFIKKFNYFGWFYCFKSNSFPAKCQFPLHSLHSFTYSRSAGVLNAFRLIGLYV